MRLNSMYELSKEQRLKLSIILMEYLNAGNWKGLFELTDCEAFAQQHTQFYEDDIWENETLEQDCIDAVEYILTKDSGNLKIIWEVDGVAAITSRKDADLHREIETLLEVADDVVANPDLSVTNPYVFDTRQSVYNALEDAQTLANAQGAASAYDLMHAALQGFFRQVCTRKGISFDTYDGITVLHAKVNDYIKGQAATGINDKLRNDKTLSMLRAAALMVDTISDLIASKPNKYVHTEADVKFAINLSRSVMRYIDDLTG